MQFITAPILGYVLLLGTLSDCEYAIIQLGFGISTATFTWKWQIGLHLLVIPLDNYRLDFRKPLQPTLIPSL
jgi:hypothetical protein